ncbi:hypothetical protein MPTK1_7g19220 [Marchantia polymorpha subsp. ruderalis]|uniref:Uncharacterized protein n=2 Tax=Marchantia polymorpha TaxID=3197 RepID=A0AAF6C1D2_MARPO|nr:hypothetical protein MARPO_0067s0056 [Marchantia polymorpha]PTQ35968.1 hypothetical protein MARPO_0067s0056 [Marchantia polymorpha]BBN18066.1 hypothetical protein Mp_7g19220 [Marchantia polymorpha subsp. ruderalis]BBN18067.1 hypothetical protein Mp_7g19220 [Marchantia polymorpha subsp. ruderalis]|eukprot:PTQ35967.1 hypothetical protein MARPO_0067s0056 [Marchantia polymorpha]
MARGFRSRGRTHAPRGRVHFPRLRSFEAGEDLLSTWLKVLFSLLLLPAATATGTATPRPLVGHFETKPLRRRWPERASFCSLACRKVHALELSNGSVSAPRSLPRILSLSPCLALVLESVALHRAQAYFAQILNGFLFSGVPKLSFDSFFDLLAVSGPLALSLSISP